MSALQHCEPHRVWELFETIASIPHGSGNTAALADYCIAFAKEHSLPYRRDEAHNVVIFKKASPGYETAPTMILQGHLDMVCAKEPGVTRNMETEGLSLSINGDCVHADGTSLGGDNGIAVAMMLAILEDPSLAHPPLEAVFTSDEEIGLLGAAALDTSDLSGRRMLNLDSEEEGIFTVSCAGGVRVEGILPIRPITATGLQATLTVSGLVGGHSGVEIHKKRGNACHLLGRILATITKQYEVQLISLNGGTVDNAIPTGATATILIREADRPAIAQTVSQCEAALQATYADEDPDLSVSLVCEGSVEASAVSAADTAQMVHFLATLPCGVQSMSPDIPGLPQTSLNLGILRTEEKAIHIVFSLRSSVEAERDALRNRLCDAFTAVGGTVNSSGEYPGWAYRKDSPLRETALASYRHLFDKEPEVVAIHAGLECGVFADKLPGLDCLSLGPNMWDIHTAKERLSISSSARTYQLILEILKNSHS